MSGETAWSVVFAESAARDLRKLGASERQRILCFLRERIATPDDPRRIGAALTGEFEGLWRYRAGDWRIVASLEHATVTVLVLRVAHRREVYR